MAAAKTGFVFDGKTTKIIEGPQGAFGASSSGEVIQRALKLAQLAAAKADKDHNILIGSGDDIVKINIST